MARFSCNVAAAKREDRIGGVENPGAQEVTAAERALSSVGLISHKAGVRDEYAGRQTWLGSAAEEAAALGLAPDRTRTARGMVVPRCCRQPKALPG